MDLNREELISAYIDDELSPSERVEVEKWLAESVELRQLHDELLAMRGSLELLPQHQLDRDLAPIVLRQAEQAVLAGSVERRLEPAVAADAKNWWLRGLATAGLAGRGGRRGTRDLGLRSRTAHRRSRRRTTSGAGSAPQRRDRSAAERSERQGCSTRRLCWNGTSGKCRQ